MSFVVLMMIGYGMAAVTDTCTSNKILTHLPFVKI
jgi:hypothetical protein